MRLWGALRGWWEAEGEPGVAYGAVGGRVCGWEGARRSPVALLRTGSSFGGLLRGLRWVSGYGMGIQWIPGWRGAVREAPQGAAVAFGKL